MLNINILRKTKHSVIALGSHIPILQSMLDFEYLASHDEPSLKAIIATGRKYVRMFFGKKEVLIPVYESVLQVPPEIKNQITLFINLSSARRVLSSTVDTIDGFQKLMGGTIFAENVPEKHSIELYHYAQKKDVFIVGPASVGLLITNKLKLGAIGGTQAQQFIDSKVFIPHGNVAVFSSSGGMTNELIRLTSQAGKRVSFSLSFGGDRFPICIPVEAFLAAEKDTETTHIIYFGELGGYDEYELAYLIKNKKIKKPVLAYIAGAISDMFETPPQFGHAKAMASRGQETAQAKARALRNAGVQATNSFTEFLALVKRIPSKKIIDPVLKHEDVENRHQALFINSISHDDEDGSVKIIGENLLKLTEQPLGFIVVSMLLGRKVKSKELSQVAEFILKLLVDHGPYVSGAINTMIAARAGKDLVSSLASGLLTIGPRFGGAINQAARHWFEGVKTAVEPYVFVENLAKSRNRISGIGHRKYRIDYPDPRVKAILSFTSKLKNKKYTTFALGVEKVTTAKKGNLILNVDGAIAAVLLDILSEKEKLTSQELEELIEIEFFNALFVLSRSVGFTAHYLDQRRLDEGLFRLTPEDITYV